MMNTFHIRLLQPSESPPMPLLLLADPSEKQVLSYFDRGECYVALLDGEIVGVSVLLQTEEHTIELMNVAVAEQCQGSGIGKKLILHALDTAKQKGFARMEVGTGNSSIGQLALYQKCGFRISAIVHDFFTRHYSEPIWENGIHCRDMIRLTAEL
ncbi:UNVERIFIED_CONTAM: ribosomal protein S18 acetylase RimI-like enzyme [Brevibacillus sp. OAP136]